MKGFDRVSYKTKSLPLHHQMDFELRVVMPKKGEVCLVMVHQIKGSSGINQNWFKLEVTAVLDGHNDFSTHGYLPLQFINYDKIAK